MQICVCCDANGSSKVQAPADWWIAKEGQNSNQNMAPASQLLNVLNNPMGLRHVS